MELATQRLAEWIPVLIWIGIGLAVLLSYKLVLRLFGVVIIPESSIGIVNKKFVIFGKNKRLPDGQIIALEGEAGFQADTLAPGLHFWKFPWQYHITIEGFTEIQQGMIGVVEAIDGKPLSAGRVLGKAVSCDAFQNARAFLAGNGERGPQVLIIPPGTYRINTALFGIEKASVTEIPQDKIGIVTTREGTQLKTGEIAGSEVAGHNSFQDGQTFITAGGNKGLQEQVILAGRYFINPRFATIELKDLTSIPIANVGVIVAYIGKEGKDVTGDAFKHGNLVSRGEKGVWNDPLDPGKYPINPYTHKVELVPTANVVLNWATGKSEAHNLDKNLSTITVRSSDGFKFNLDVSQIIHIPRTDAPKVIARFGNMINLVTQVLEPTIGNYFRNAAQSSDVIDFLRNRATRQKEAKESISAAIESYNVNAVDTLIGDITPPEELMKTLTDRKIAEQEKVTYNTQMQAETVRKEREQATAMADTQKTVVAAERGVSIAEFAAKAAIAKAGGEADAKVRQADADAAVLIKVGNAEAGKTLAIGNAEAEVIQKKTTAVGQGNYALMQVMGSLADNKVPLVPQIMAGGNSGKEGEGSSSSLVNVLLATMIANATPAPNGGTKTPNPFEKRPTDKP